MVVQSLRRLTLVRKGRAMAKHPDMRDGAVEKVASTPLADELEGLEFYDEDQPPALLDSPSYAWYEAFDRGEVDDTSEAKESAKSTKNYPDSQGPFAGPHNSFPIRNQSDVLHAAQRLHNAKGDQASIKSRIIAIARAHGYKLPKSWSRKKTSAMTDDELQSVIKALRDDILAHLQLPNLPVQPSSDPSTFSNVPEAPADPATPPTPEDKQAAGRPKNGHNHSHSHVTTYGYSYSHSHQHGDAQHAADDNEEHSMSETQHAHEHVAKAAELKNPDVDALIADVTGLSKDLETAKTTITEKESALATAEASVAELKEKLAAAEAKVQAAEDAKAQAEQTAATEVAKAQARKPLTAYKGFKLSSAPTVTKEMSFDDAFNTIMRPAERVED